MARSKKKVNLDEDEPGGFDVEEALEEEINKPYYDVFYLDNFKLPYEKLDVSMVIITKNRCPYKPRTLKEYQNPLAWSIKTALMQKPPIKELILVDDASEDYTEEYVNEIRASAESRGIKFEYIKNKECLGPGMARNIGTKKSSSKYIIFLDDDAFLAPYASFGAIYTFEKMAKKGIRVGLINLPTYRRSTVPSISLPKKDIGALSFLKVIFKSNKDAFPQEYISADANEKFLDSELSVLNPFPILNINTTALLCSKSCFEDVGGFREHNLNRGEDREFGCRVIENGYTMYFQPDIKFHCVHGSYGLSNGEKFRGDDWFKKLNKSISIKKAMKICNDPKENTGTRVNHADYIYQTMVADFFLTYMRNKKGAINWLKKIYSNFVKDGSEDFLGERKMGLPSEDERRKIWKSVIRDGLKLIKVEEKRNLRKISTVIKKLENDSTVENVFDTLESLD
jgi:GT2 family glycosyltransferase